MVQQNSLMEVVFLFLLCPKKIWGLSGKKRFFKVLLDIHTFVFVCIFALQSKLIKDVYTNGPVLIGLTSANYIKHLYMKILQKYQYIQRYSSIFIQKITLIVIYQKLEW